MLRHGRVPQDSLIKDGIIRQGKSFFGFLVIVR